LADLSSHSSIPRTNRARRVNWWAAAAYVALSIVFTWPLAKGLARDVPGDFGDPLLNMWILAWDAGHLGRFDAPIFAPHPLALAYSEHLTPQAILVWPVYWLTRNPILSYNVLFLATFAASAFGMFLLARELTGKGAAAFVAGVAFGFAPYRVASIPHLQVLSSAWMPFALFGFRRYFKSRRLAPLAGGALAWLGQSLSCGYYLLFFSPVVAIYLAWELSVRRLWSNRRVLVQLVAASVVVGVATLPFVVPYLELRRSGFNPRTLGETQKYSADVYAYFTADPALKFWGSIARAWPIAEGALFPGLTIAVLATAAVVLSWRRLASDAHEPSGTMARLFGGLAAAAAALAVLLLLGWTLRLPATKPIVKITSVSRVAAFAVAAAAIWLRTSARARGALGRWWRSPVAFFVVITAAAFAMSLGPAIHARGRLVEAPSIYRAFYLFVPGVDGLRVPARFAMIVAFGLAVLAGCGISLLERTRRVGYALAAVTSLLIVGESCAVPIPLNQNDTTYRQHDLAPLPATISLGEQTPAVYRFVQTLPPASVLLELPLGEPAFDVRYMFYAIGHGRALVNGYSGGAPDDYGLLAETLGDVRSRPDEAWRAIAASAATHLIVHERSYAGGGGDISSWVRGHGALEVAAFDGDRIFQLR
jgi:hypothetical protein